MWLDSRASRLATITLSLSLVDCAELAVPSTGMPPCWRVHAPGVDPQPTVQWTAPDDADDARDARRWCAAVGPALVQLGAIEPSAADSILFLTWNTHVGEGALNRLIGDLRSGELTNGESVEHFVLLLQEASRASSAVPTNVPDWSKTASRIASDEGAEPPIDETARQYDLHLFYAPAMTNGDVREGDPPEDRGNAILSSFPLENLRVIELPLERQRRIAVAADATGARSDGVPWRIHVTTLHLENHRKGLGLLWSFGSFRATQARALLEAVQPDSLAVLGGDFNTWAGEDDEEAIELVRQVYPLPRELLDSETYAWVFGDRRVDYLVYRADSTLVDRNQMVPDVYGSDHRALMGWLRLGSP